VGHLRPLSDRLHVRDAARHRRPFSRGMDPDDPAGSCTGETPVPAAAGGARPITLNSKGRTP
jgi:hypothetical protein